MEVPEPASPIRHEGAVLSTGANAEFAAPPVTNSFAPGSGQLQEEILEDEDVEGSAFHASSIEEMDDLEEETLEGAADLGTMLREMSIDNITRTAPELEDEDDEEDDLEEDDLEEDDDEQGESSDEIDDRAGADQAGDADDDLHEQAAHFEQDFNEPSDAMQFNQPGEQSAGASSPARDADRDLGRDSERRGGRRDGRRGQRGDRDRGRGGRSGHSGRGRMSMQSTNLPVISDLLKPGQEILVQIAKEPIAKKGARITSHIALPGRFLVFMPTVNHTGV
jgi:ribonuclease G